MSCPGSSGERSDRPSRYLLVVDDEAAFRDVLALVLTDEGYLVRVAGDGLEALGLARREPPDLVLLDVMMPRVSGHEVLAAMARDVALSSVPVLVMSGSSWDGARHDGANVVGFVKKPVHLEALLQKIAVVLA